LKFISPSWDNIFEQSVKLAQKIRYDQSKIGTPKFQVIIGVSRGGLVLARLISDLLEIDDVVITKSEYYSGMGKKNKKPTITEKIHRNISGKNVLLVDDVSDTGESLIEIKKHVQSKKPKYLAVATLYLKPWSKRVPDYYVSKTDAWIIFPWELYESYKLLKSRGGLRLLNRSKIPAWAIKRLKNYDESVKARD
jgi:hypoxanthine phosphoribosyltransferase